MDKIFYHDICCKVMQYGYKLWYSKFLLLEKLLKALLEN